MKSSGLLITLGIICLAATVAWADHITADYDHSVNFGKFRTYMWIKDSQINEPFMKERIMAAVNTQLSVRGLSLVQEGADLAVGAHLATEEQHVWETYYNGSGWGWDGGGAGWSTTTEKTYEVGTLTVDVFDSCTKKLAWQGTGTDELSSHPSKRTKEFDKQVARMFREFPPVMLHNTIEPRTR